MYVGHKLAYQKYFSCKCTKNANQHESFRNFVVSDDFGKLFWAKIKIVFELLLGHSFKRRGKQLLLIDLLKAKKVSK